MSDAVQCGKEVIHRRKTQQALAKPAPLQHFSFQLCVAGGRRKHEPLTHCNLPARFHQGTPQIFARGLGQQHFDKVRLAAWRSRTMCSARIKPRRNHPAVVQDQQVSRPQAEKGTH